MSLTFFSAEQIESIHQATLRILSETGILLTFPDHEAAAILEIASLGIAFGPLPCPTAGTTAMNASTQRAPRLSQRTPRKKPL